MKIGVEYLRYSSERQTEQSIEGQMRVCDEYAERNGIVIVERYIDRAMTGRNDQRDEFQRMLKDSAKKAWDFVLVYKTDRFGRNKYEMSINKHTLKQNGVKLISATENIPDTPEGIILESLLEGMAEYYSAELSQKVLRGMYENRQKGKYLGGNLIYGYKVIDKKVYIDETKAEIVRSIYRQYAEGVYVKDIIQKLTEKGIYHRGQPFKVNTVYKMLKNEKYLGIIRCGDEIFNNIYPQIVPKELFDIVRKKVEDNHYGKKVKIVYLLKKKAVCGYCGKPITSDAGTSANGQIIRYYKCLGRKKYGDCNKSAIKKEILEKIVVDTTLTALNNKQNLEILSEKVMARYEKQLADNSLLHLLKTQKAESERSLENIMLAMEKGIVTSSTKKRIEDLESKIKDFETKIKTEENKETFSLSKNQIINFILHALKKNPEFMIRLLVKRIVLYDDKIEIYYNYTDKKTLDDENHRAFSFYNEIYDYETKIYRFCHEQALHGYREKNSIKIQLLA